jgi:hypothetical protein
MGRIGLFIVIKQLLIFINCGNSCEDASHKSSTHKLDEIFDVLIVVLSKYSAVAFVHHILLHP